MYFETSLTTLKFLCILLCRMVAMGMTLKTEDFTRVLSTSSSGASNDQATAIKTVPVGLVCQYVIMPLTAFLIGSAALLPEYPAAFLGLVLVGCSPGGTASNLVSLIAKADVALSVILTSLSTIMASLLTPLLVKTLVGSAVSISGWALCKATAQVVLAPVALGMVVREKLPRAADFVGRFASFAGVLLVSLLCGGVVAQNAGMTVNGTPNILPTIVFSVLGLHGVGFALGYLASKKLFGLSEKVSRTICIETGMQNSALAVVLARSVIGNDPALASVVSLACLPGAFSATVHSCLGSALAVFWRWWDRRCTSFKSKKSDA
jgi:Predicted Na+-dependent transporter